MKNLVKPNKDNTDTFYALLQDMSSDLDVHAEIGKHEYARVRINEDDVALVESMAKAIAERLGKNVRKVRCVEIARRYESPANSPRDR